MSLCIHVTWRRGLPSSGTWLNITPQKNRILNYIAVEPQSKGWYCSTGRIITPNHHSLLISIHVHNPVLSYQRLILDTIRWTLGSTWWPTKFCRSFALFCAAVSPPQYRQSLRCIVLCFTFMPQIVCQLIGLSSPNKVKQRHYTFDLYVNLLLL